MTILRPPRFRITSGTHGKPARFNQFWVPALVACLKLLAMAMIALIGHSFKIPSPNSQITGEGGCVRHSTSMQKRKITPTLCIETFRASRRREREFLHIRFSLRVQSSSSSVEGYFAGTRLLSRRGCRGSYVAQAASTMKPFQMLAELAD